MNEEKSDKMLDEETLNKHKEILKKHDEILKKHEETLNKCNESSQYDEHNMSPVETVPKKDSLL